MMHVQCIHMSNCQSPCVIMRAHLRGMSVYSRLFMGVCIQRQYSKLCFQPGKMFLLGDVNWSAVFEPVAMWVDM